MGVDIVKKKNTERKESLSKNLYVRLLIKLYRFLARRTDSEFNKVVLKRLMMTRHFKRPITLERLAKLMQKQKNPNQIAVVVGTITSDSRQLEGPKGIRVCALRVTESARKKIVENGGEVLTFDQLALASPDGKGAVLLRGNFKTEVKKQYGTPCQGNHTKPKVRSKGRMFEKGRGRRPSKGFSIKNK